MLYAELLWVDRLGLYIRAELLEQPPSVVRVPFYRPVLDERDARSVMTMAAQLAWEQVRKPCRRLSMCEHAWMDKEVSPSQLIPLLTG
jgi:hypothetical protein